MSIKNFNIGVYARFHKGLITCRDYNERYPLWNPS